MKAQPEAFNAIFSRLKYFWFYDTIVTVNKYIFKGAYIMKLKALTAAALSVVLITATGCSNENWIDKYSDYLDYSMKSWNVTDVKETEEDGKTYTQWTMSFKDAYDNDATYTISNKTDIKSDIAFGVAVSDIASDIAEKELQPMLGLSEDELGLRNGADFCGDIYVYDFKYLQTDEQKRNEYLKSLISQKDGIKLSEVTAGSYLTGESRMAFIYFITTSKDEAERAAYQQRIDGIVESIRKQIGEEANILAVLNYENKDKKREAISYRAFIDGSEINLENTDEFTPAQQYNKILQSSYGIY